MALSALRHPTWLEDKVTRLPITRHGQAVTCAMKPVTKARDRSEKFLEGSCA